jgi:hypothetical protein
MRTKTLYLSALLGAVSIATSVAQTVYSVNAVGYVNVTLVPGFNLVANPLVAETNTVAVLFNDMPNSTVVYKFDAATQAYVSNIKNFGRWTDTAMTLLPGEGAFVKNPRITNIVITFVGEVMQGNLTNALPAGYALVSSMVPQEDKVTTLGYPPAAQDTLYLWDVAGQAYLSYIYNFGRWTPSEPTIKVAEAFFAKKKAAANWVRVFSVNAQ